MSLYDYRESAIIEMQSYPFYALIMAAMRQADTENYGLLQSAFPEIYRELIARYNAPGGVLPNDVYDSVIFDNSSNDDDDTAEWDDEIGDYGEGRSETP